MNTKAKGIRNAAIPRRTASYPVSHTLLPEIPEVTNTAMQVGGV